MPSIQRVLIVEDLPNVSRWLGEQVHQALQPAHIVFADSLAQAHVCIANQDINLALLDLGLPDGEGATLIPKLKAANPDTICIITTIFDDADHLFGSLRAGADGYLLKDDADTDFIHHLEGILNGRPPLSPSIARRMLKQFHPVKTNDVQLTPRERDMLTLIAKGFSVRVAAEHLAISPHTAAGYLKIIYQKLQINCRAEATLQAINMGLVNPN